MRWLRPPHGCNAGFGGTIVSQIELIVIKEVRALGIHYRGGGKCVFHRFCFSRRCEAPGVFYSTNQIQYIMKKFIERLLAISVVATVIFASGDTCANLMAAVTSAAIAACCQWKLNTLGNE